MSGISWHRTSVGEEELSRIREAMLNECVSMGRVTEELERQLALALEVPYCVVVPSGSVALFMALKAVGVGPGDEVIVPDRGWVAAAHAVMLAGAKVVLADVRREVPIIDVADVRRRITSRTRAVIPLHLNGRSADMRGLLRLAKEYGFAVVEDACQALFSKNEDGFIGTQGILGCYSLGMAKMVATGQGGFIVTRDEPLFRKLRALRSHGVKDNFTDAWYQWGLNFKFTDIQAAMGLAQLQRAPGRICHLKAVDAMYKKALSGMKGIDLIPVKVEDGEIPLYIEVLVDRRDQLVNFLAGRDIQTRLATPALHPTPYFENKGDFPNSIFFGEKGLYLPGGPEQPLENVEIVIQSLKAFEVLRKA